jgi:carbohydrate diacid regulator
MELQESDAREIVTEISKLLGTKLNIMNSRGFIIASSDAQRVGSFHAGAYEIIEKNLDSLEIDEESNWEGAVPGQNFPIRLHGRIIGVVGITGEAGATRKYGSIIRKMTEILVEGKAREEDQRNRETAVSRFLVDWINNDQDAISDSLIQRGNDFGIDITVPRRIAALYIDPNNAGSAGNAEKTVRTAVMQYDPASLCFNSSNYLVVVFGNVPDKKTEETAGKILEKTGRYGLRLFMGIGPAETDYLNIRKNYQYAKKALAVSRKREKSNVVFYSELGIELVSEVVPLLNKTAFLQKVFHGIEQGSLDETLSLLKTFYNQDGSLKAAAAELGIHPNTLQYRLNRIYELTGYNPRRYKDAMQLQVALMFSDELRKNGF